MISMNCDPSCFLMLSIRPIVPPIREGEQSSAMIRRTGEGVCRVSEVTERGAGAAGRREGFWRRTLLSVYPFVAMAAGRESRSC